MGWLCRTVAVGVLIAASPARADLEPSELGWPADTKVATTRHHVRVYARAGSKRIGTLDAGARLAIRRIVRTGDDCRAWVELAPRGWVCARELAPSVAEPDAATPSPPAREMAGINRGTSIYADVQSIEEGAPTRSVHGHTMVALRGAIVRVDNVAYAWTDQGWIRARDLQSYAPSTHQGREFAPGDPLDFGWVVRRKAGKLVARTAPSSTAEVARTIAHHEVVAVLDRAAGFVRIGDDAWVAEAEVRRPAVTPRPDGLADTDRWIDVDLDQQVLVAYEGDTPVYATVVSTGLASATPTGVYRIRGKELRTRMQNPAEVPDQNGWNVADVPYAMRFRKNFALHGAYWHDGFGTRRSQGCVNLAPKDARWLFDWVSPNAPAGWVSVDDDGGTVVRIRDARTPSPRWLDYEGHAIPLPVVAR